jgi:F1F0 ATPase subunit 2
MKRGIIMNENFSLLLSPLAGIGVGFLFYGGLWLTVSRIASAKRPWLLLVANSAARTALALAAIWWVSQGSAARIALCVFGFMATRPLVFRLTRSVPPPHPQTAKEPRCT